MLRVSIVYNNAHDKPKYTAKSSVELLAYKKNPKCYLGDVYNIPIVPWVERISQVSFREDNLTYYNRLHKQLERKKEKPTNCSKCGRNDLQIEWANISGEYRDLDDFTALCKSCHQLYDQTTQGKTTGGRPKKVVNTSVLQSIDFPNPRGATTATAIATELNPFNTTATVAQQLQLQLSIKEQNLLFEELRALVNVQFRAWYCSMFNKLGRERVLRLASIAKADTRTDASRYFSWLLKNNPTGN